MGTLDTGMGTLGVGIGTLGIEMGTLGIGMGTLGTGMGTLGAGMGALGIGMGGVESPCLEVLVPWASGKGVLGLRWDSMIPKIFPSPADSMIL